ncbi:hypothetical protein JW905_10135 [bacterium]|nr:hypothetical protein [candidate division CSSED10-310 bacterium]
MAPAEGARGASRALVLAAGPAAHRATVEPVAETVPYATATSWSLLLAEESPDTSVNHDRRCFSSNDVAGV